MEKVRYEELLPHEFEARLRQRPLAYLPLGTLEWHERHLPLGSDMLINGEIFARCAREFGGIVLPALFVAPDNGTPGPDGRMYYGMDLSDPAHPRQLTGSCYRVEGELYAQLLEALLAQVARAGFKAVVAGGHAPADYCWAARSPAWSARFGLTLINLFHDGVGTPLPADHAGQCETSLVLATRPELVDLGRLPSDRSVPLTGVCGVDPRDASAELGERYVRQLMDLISRKLALAGAAGR